MKLFWRIIRIPLAVVVLLLVGLTIYRIPFVLEARKTQKAVEFIRAQKITLDDVNGKHLPPSPDPAKVDATVEGVDANGNGIRDDVELAIFKRYPNSARIRAAELQYAKGVQLELTKIFNNETWIAVAKLESRSIGCIVDVAFGKYLDVKNQIAKSGEWRKEVEALAFNTDTRKAMREEIKKYETAFSSGGDETCDVKFSTSEN